MSRQALDLDYFEKILVYKSLTDERYLPSVITMLNHDSLLIKALNRYFRLLHHSFKRDLQYLTKLRYFLSVIHLNLNKTLRVL